MTDRENYEKRCALAAALQRVLARPRRAGARVRLDLSPEELTELCGAMYDAIDRNRLEQRAWERERLFSELRRALVGSRNYAGVLKRFGLLDAPRWRTLQRDLDVATRYCQLTRGYGPIDSPAFDRLWMIGTGPARRDYGSDRNEMPSLEGEPRDSVWAPIKPEPALAVIGRWYDRPRRADQRRLLIGARKTLKRVNADRESYPWWIPRFPPPHDHFVIPEDTA